MRVHSDLEKPEAGGHLPSTHALRVPNEAPFIYSWSFTGNRSSPQPLAHQVLYQAASLIDGTQVY